MKNLFLSIVVTLMAISANAQVFIGGGAGISSSKVNEGESITSYKFVPEIGYNFNENWAAGIAFGWQGSNKGGSKSVMVNPYARYVFFHSKIVEAFVDGGIGYEHKYGKNVDADVFTVGLKPGIEVKLTNHLSIETHIGFIGYEHNKLNGVKANSFGLDIDGSNVLFGVEYTF